MRKYLKEIEFSGIILMFIGCIMYRFFEMKAGFIAATIGILLWLVSVIFKAFYWQEYRRDNKQNIAMMLIAIILLFCFILFIK
jgi:uncharacterized membrane protein HdeD (DUF308 family)